jgi:hypothetical protein
LRSLEIYPKKKPSFRPSKWPRKLKTAKNSKLQKLLVEKTVLSQLKKVGGHRYPPGSSNPSMEWEIRKLRARLDSMEIMPRTKTNSSDISEVGIEEMEVEEYAKGDTTYERFLKAILKMGAKEKIGVPMYEGILDVEKLLDWIRALEKYFDYEEIKDEKKVKHVVTRLKGHAMLWCGELQDERRHKVRKRSKIGIGW